MKIEETPFKGCFLISPELFVDERGIFFEAYNKERYKEILPNVNFVQDNLSFSKKGSLRGLHFQRGEYAQAKLVSVIKGKVQDVIVDIRKKSSTFRQYHSVILDDNKRQQLFIPRGFAHGFLALTDNVIFNYKCDNYYHNESESGIIYDDPELNIDWELSNNKLLLSKKDKGLSSLNSLNL